MFYPSPITTRFQSTITGIITDTVHNLHRMQMRSGRNKEVHVTKSDATTVFDCFFSKGLRRHRYRYVRAEIPTTQ